MKNISGFIPFERALKARTSFEIELWCERIEFAFGHERERLNKLDKSAILNHGRSPGSGNNPAILNENALSPQRELIAIGNGSYRLRRVWDYE